LASLKATISPPDRSTAAFWVAIFPARGRSRTMSAPAARASSTGRSGGPDESTRDVTVGGPVGGDDQLELLARILLGERVRDLGGDHILLVEGGDDQRDGRELGWHRRHGAADRPGREATR